MAKTGDKNVQNDTPATNKAEGDRWESDSETVERYDKTVGGGEQAGISNRSIDEELDNQDALPERGRRKAEDEP
jgi:hypothetical protein